MKLSEILAAPEAANEYFGVYCDVDSFVPPKGIKRIRFMAEWVNNEIDVDIVDMIIAYGLAGIEVGLEIPAEDECPPEKYLIHMAKNLNCSLTLLPPYEGDKKAFEKYADRVVAFTNEYLTHRNFVKDISPVTNYLTYLFCASMKDMTDFVPDDSYLRSRFHDVVAVEKMDAVKARIRDTVHANFGGESAFSDFAKMAILGTRRMLIEQVKSTSHGDQPGTDQPAGA